MRIRCEIIFHIYFFSQQTVIALTRNWLFISRVNLILERKYCGLVVCLLN